MRLFLLIGLFCCLWTTVWAQEAIPEPLQATETITTESSSAKKTNADNSGKATSAKKNTTSDSKPVNLETAYKREYAFLDAQKRELKALLDKYKASANSKEQELIRKINALERESVSRSAKIDQFNSQILEAERTQAAVSERNDALEITYAQSELTLKQYGIEMPPAMKEGKENDLEKTTFLLQQGLALIQKLGEIQSKAGKFFLESGKQAEGSIIQLGNIAAFGISADGGGALVPAGNGEFKVWKEPAADIASALSKNEQPEYLKLFLFESRTTAIDETPDKTVISIIESGGMIGWIIVGLGVLALLLALVRALLLRKNSTDNKQLADQITALIAEGRLSEAKKICDSGVSAISRVLASTLRHLKDDREHMEDIVHEAILHEAGPLDRFGSTIMVIASVAPLLGLLGTVTGMITTFDVITEFGTGDPKLLSGGISIALVTTELGLIVAIPTLMLGSLLNAWARNIRRDIEHSALRATNAFLGGQPGNSVAMDSGNGNDPEVQLLALQPQPA